MPKYTLGIDFGTLSARCVLVNTENGEIIKQAVCVYEHGVIDSSFKGKPLGSGWALHDPADYITVLKTIFRDVLSSSNISAEDIIGIGIDSTASTLLPIKKDGTPLSFIDSFKDNPLTYAVLWKHHASQQYAEKMEEVALERGEKFLKLYGGKISSEWTLPKILQILLEAPEIYKAADYFIDAADWMNYLLTGILAKGASCAGFKAFWDADSGYPSEDYFASVNPHLRHVIRDKFNIPILKLGSLHGKITEKGSSLTGLPLGMPVVAANMDAHVSCIGVGVINPGSMMSIVGTSACHILMSETLREIKGVCGIIKDGVIPGYYAYEAGQSAVGEIFQWFIDNFIKEKYFDEAKKLNLDIFAYLGHLTQSKTPGYSGLVSLDWLNGNRSMLVDFNLTGLLLGFDVLTRPEDVYKSLVESTAFGARKIISEYESHGIEINEIVACGGIAAKDRFIMQVYADVLDKTIKVPRLAQSSAFSCAVLGAVVAGKKSGGYDTIDDAVANMSPKEHILYKPRKDKSLKYEELYEKYDFLYNFFGIEQKSLMKALKINRG